MYHRNYPAGYFYQCRYLAIPLVILGFWIQVAEHKSEPMLCALLTATLLPGFYTDYTHTLFLGINLYILLRSAVMLDAEWGIIKNHVTKLSVKEAVNAYPGGILYANARGSTLILNPSMKNLFMSLDINPELDIVEMWETLVNNESTGHVRVQKLDRDKVLIRLKDDRAWLLSLQMIEVSRKQYWQLLAFDITSEDLMNRELEANYHRLKQTEGKLMNSLEQVEQLVKEREIVELKTRVHDILGQRLTILNRLLDKDVDWEDGLKHIKSLVEDLTQDVVSPTEKSPEHLLMSITQSYATIGTQVHLEGTLPPDTEAAFTILQVIRESATNAVRHGAADNVYVALEDHGNHFTLKVRNDGTPPREPIREGGGLAGMRRQIESLSGKFIYNTNPGFTICAHVPTTGRENVYDQSTHCGRPGDCERFADQPH